MFSVCLLNICFYAFWTLSLLFWFIVLYQFVDITLNTLRKHLKVANLQSMMFSYICTVTVKIPPARETTLTDLQIRSCPSVSKSQRLLPSILVFFLHSPMYIQSCFFRFFRSQKYTLRNHQNQRGLGWMEQVPMILTFSKTLLFDLGPNMIVIKCPIKFCCCCCSSWF